MRLACFVACLALLVPAAQAQMYKCVDANGRVQYSDKPLPGCKGGPVDIQPIPPLSGQVASPPPPSSNAQQDADFKRRQMERERQETFEKSAQAERCQRVRQEIAWLSAGTRLSRITDSGERVYMDDATREARLSQLQQQVRGCP
jgi:Domain of unknown function (DUF4124)